MSAVLKNKGSWITPTDLSLMPQLHDSHLGALLLRAIQWSVSTSELRAVKTVLSVLINILDTNSGAKSSFDSLIAETTL